MESSEKIERQETKENKEAVFGFYIEQGINHALGIIKERFEDTPDERDRLPFHKEDHTRKGVVPRTGKILSTLAETNPELVTAHEVGLGRLAAGFHDTVQQWEENRISEGGFTRVMRRRFSGDNERASAEEAVQFMEKANRESGEMLFSDKDKEMVHGAIMVTVPDFDPKNGTVIQPSLTPGSDIIARAVALGDLGTAGMDGSGGFLPEGDRLFCEENLDILDALKNPAAIPEPGKEYFKRRMLAWTASQDKFALGRQALLQNELRGIPEPGHSRVEKLFDKFDLSIKTAKERLERRQNMTFEELARDIGYLV